MTTTRTARRIAFGSTIALVAILTLTLFTAYAATPAAPAQTDNCQSFTETGFTVCGRFLEYWNTNGGLAQQGFPISNVFEEKNADPPSGDGKLHRVQYFQRARFEEHTGNAAPYDVLLGLLGSEQYSINNTVSAEVIMPGECQTFTETSQKVCGKFLTYWKNHGGLAQQGLPVSDAFFEKNAEPPAGDGKIHVVQYFQRARFEEHTENAAPYDVLLGLVGTEQFKAKYPNGSPANAPTVPPVTTMPVATAPATTTAAPTTVAPTTPPATSSPVNASGCLPIATQDGVQACVSNSNPSKSSTVTVYGRLIVGGKAVAGASMNTTWHYKTTSPGCSSTAGSDGVASCSRNIGGATSGYTVDIDVVFSYNGQNYFGSTEFTPK